MKSVRSPYSWSSPLVVAATHSMTPAFLSKMLSKQGENYDPYVSWYPKNPMQNEFFAKAHVNSALRIANLMLLEEKPELVGIAHNQVEPVNRLLATNGFPDVKLDPIGPNGFAVATVIKMLRHFKVAGEGGYLFDEEMQQEAFRLSDENFEAARFPSGDTLVKITFANGDSLYIYDGWTDLEGPVLSNWAAEKMSLLNSMSPVSNAKGLVLPNVKFDIEVDVSFLLDAEAKNALMHSWWIRQAIKKVRFSMGPLGFLFEAAFAMSMEKSISMPKFPEPDDIVIKDDFVAWFVSNGGDTFSPFPTWVVKVPIFAFEYESIDIPTEIPAVVIPD